MSSKIFLGKLTALDDARVLIYNLQTMMDLIRRWRGEGEIHGISLDGKDASCVFVCPLSGGRMRAEFVEKSVSNAWLCSRKDLTFNIRHIRVPVDYKGSLLHYAKAFSPEKFPVKGETIIVRTEAIQDPDGTIFVHGISERKHREILKDFTEAGIDPRKARGLVPPAVALHQALLLMDRQELPRFLVVLHGSDSGLVMVGIRGGRPVFHRYLPMRRWDKAAGQEPFQQAYSHQLSLTIRHLENEPHFGVPDEVILAGAISNAPTILEDAKTFFPKSRIRLLDPSKNIVSESMSVDDVRAHALAIGAAALGLDQKASRLVNFLTEPAADVERKRSETVYDKIILASGAAMLALAFVTANAFFLDVTKSRLEKMAANQKTIESLRTELRRLEPELESATRLLNAAAVRLDASKSKTFSIPASAAKLISAIESAAPEGITLDKIESGAAASTQGRYSNLSYQGDPVTVAISGKADLPEQAIFFQDALRETLGVSVDILSMGREGDFWSRKPVNFVIVLRGAIRRA